MSHSDRPITQLIFTQPTTGTTLLTLFFIVLLIIAYTVSYTTDAGVGMAITAIVILTIGSQIPRHPHQKKHHLSLRTRVILGQIFFSCMALLAVWTVGGGFAAYFFVNDYVGYYCTECVKNSCGCDELCSDHFKGLRTATYVFLSLSIFFALIFVITFGRWTQELLRHFEKDDSSVRNGLSRYIQAVPLPSLDWACCCCCPGVKHCYTMKTVGNVAHGVEDAAEAGIHVVGAGVDAVGAGLNAGLNAGFSFCEAFGPVICICCCIAFYIVVIVLCYDSSVPTWIRVISCIIAFIIYLFVEIAGAATSSSYYEYEYEYHY
jgi:hypothetical protein